MPGFLDSLSDAGNNRKPPIGAKAYTSIGEFDAPPKHFTRVSPPMSWKILRSGYVPEYLYERGRLDESRPFTALEKLSHVKARAHAADKDREFSRWIREGLPKPSPRN